MSKHFPFYQALFHSERSIMNQKVILFGEYVIILTFNLLSFRYVQKHIYVYC